DIPRPYPETKETLARTRGPLRKMSRRRPTPPPRYRDSTIGAGGLNFRVRNGTGCFPSAIATETVPLVRPESPIPATPVTREIREDASPGPLFDERARNPMASASKSQVLGL